MVMHVHHKTYKRLGREHDEDLQALCMPCHVDKHPDKVGEFGGPLFAEHECHVCEHMLATMFLGARGQHFICLRCQEPAFERYRSTNRKKRKKKKNGAVPCPECGTGCQNEWGMLQHRHDKHGIDVSVRLDKLNRKAKTKKWKARGMDPKYSRSIKDWT